MKLFGSIKSRIVLFSLVVSLLFLIIVGLAILNVNRIVQSANLMQTNYIPLLESVHYANSALQEGQIISHQLMLDVNNPENYDEVRKYESQFKQTMITFDMYIKAVIWGSESEAFSKSSGGLTHKMWVRKEVKLKVKKAPHQIQQPFGKADMNYAGFTNNTLRAMKSLKKALRLKLLGKIEEAEVERNKLTDYQNKARKYSARVSDLFSKIDDELKRYLSVSVSNIERTQHIAQTTVIALSIILFIVVTLFTIIFPNRLIVHPIKLLAEAVKAMGKGKLDTKIDIKKGDELGQLANSFNEMSEDLRKTTVSRDDLLKEVAERKKAEQEVKAANQQLGASEQQLRASNLQLVANEQQLRSINQNLRSHQEELKRKQEELQKAHEQLKESTAQIIQSEKLSALGELSAGVAHELKQPLNVIKILSQALTRDISKNRLDQEELKQDLDEVTHQANRMSEIIDHMRIFTRKSIGGTKEKVQLNGLVESMLSLSRAQMEAHNIELTVDYSQDIPDVLGDPISIEQVIMNLLNNAKSAVDSNNGEKKQITIRTYALEPEKSPIRKQSVAVEVEDNGRGIPEHLRKKVFDQFFTTKSPGEGTGLGLSISRKIVEEHKGTIEFDSTANEGATFRMVLPVACEQ